MENEELSLKLRHLERDVNEVRKEVEEQSHVFQGKTYRSQHVPTVIQSANSIPENPLEEIDFEAESSKMLDDYQKLLVENESMKRLYS